VAIRKPSSFVGSQMAVTAVIGTQGLGAVPVGTIPTPSQASRFTTSGFAADYGPLEHHIEQVTLDVAGQIPVSGAGAACFSGMDSFGEVAHVEFRRQYTGGNHRSAR